VLEASFVDDRILARQGVSTAIVEEVSLRTPGFESWQAQTWPCHCGDAAVFLGDATQNEIETMTEAELKPFLEDCKLDREDWFEIVAGYVPAGDPAVYKFRCRVCDQRLFALDCA
jgi:uncharacterized protein CbrC (UPF0167 family)